MTLTCGRAAEASDFSKDALGTTGAQFLELPVGARAIAMGSVQGAGVGNATALYYNPANLTTIPGGNVVFMQAQYFQGISYQYAAIAQRLDGIGTVAVGVQKLSPGALDEVDNTGNPTGDSLNPRDTAAAVGYANSFGPVDIGIGGKYITSKIQNSASTVAGDIGARFRAGKFALLVSAMNLGRGLKFREKREDLPTTIRAGLSFETPRIMLVADAVAPRGVQPFAAVGVEGRLPIAGGFGMAGRVGYNSRTQSSKLGGMTGFSAGGGISYGKRVQVDYAWSPYGDLGNAHRISLGFSW